MADANIPEGCSYLLSSKSKRMTLIFLLLGTFMGLVFLLGTHFVIKGSWVGLVAPVFLVAAPLMSFPLTEAWAYVPWQAKSCKYEHHHID